VGAIARLVQVKGLGRWSAECYLLFSHGRPDVFPAEDVGIMQGLQKLKDVDGFATMFLSYDLLARKYGRYGYVYPFVETGAGLLMLAGAAIWHPSICSSR
jgi:3-methyladenine DNA glycosylase/8-oxoguanine DNA glycosylase